MFVCACLSDVHTYRSIYTNTDARRVFGFFRNYVFDQNSLRLAGLVSPGTHGTYQIEPTREECCLGAPNTPLQAKSEQGSLARVRAGSFLLDQYVPFSWGLWNGPELRARPAWVEGGPPGPAGEVSLHGSLAHRPFKGC